MGCRRYYTLIASLPPLPRFDRAERLPINRERLLERLHMLDAADGEVVEKLLNFLSWERQGRDRSDRAIVAEYREISTHMEDPACRKLVQAAVTLRTILAALRRRHLGRPAPQPGEIWGMGPWADTLRRNWEHPDFKLAGVFPWLPTARKHLEAGESLALERLLIEMSWKRLERMKPVDGFRFEALLIYLFQWNLLEQWLSYGAEAAQARFDELIAEAIGEYDELLH